VIRLDKHSAAENLEEKNDEDLEEEKNKETDKLPKKNESWRTYRPEEFRDWKTVPTCR